MSNSGLERKITRIVVYSIPALMAAWGLLLSLYSMHLDTDGILDDDEYGRAVGDLGGLWIGRALLLFMLIVVVRHPQESWECLCSLGRSIRDAVRNIGKPENNEHPSP